LAPVIGHPQDKADCVARTLVDAWGDIQIRGVTYVHTNRTLTRLRQKGYLRGELATDRLKGRRILDLPAGDGAVVTALRKEGIDAVGLDYAYSSKAPKEGLLRGDWLHLPFTDGQFDSTMMNNGIFLYSRRYQDAELIAALKEAMRVTSKNGGEILIMGVSEPGRLDTLADKLGLKLKNFYQNNDEYTATQSQWTYHYIMPPE